MSAAGPVRYDELFLVDDSWNLDRSQRGYCGEFPAAASIERRRQPSAK